MERFKKTPKKISSNGLVIASIPNVRFYEVIYGLMFKDEWNYSDAGGILDSTHLRFFTLKTIKKIFKKCGFEIVQIEKKLAGKRKLRRINRVLCGLLTPFFVWQYFIVARPVEK